MLKHAACASWMPPVQAGKIEPLGFLCMVNALRDRPQLPAAEDLDRLRKNPVVAGFIAL